MTLLEKKLCKMLQDVGGMAFRDFMESALYDVEFGYYATRADRIGRSGDYYTSSSVSTHFGRLLAVQAVRIWEKLGKPENFTIVECGPGTGHLALDFLSELEELHPNVFANARYVLCERSPALRALQSQRLARFGSHVEWSSLETLSEAPITGLIFSNELVDALPVHRVKVKNGALLECFITEREGKLHMAWDAPSRPAEFQEYVEKARFELREGHEYEIGLDAVIWLGAVASCLARGFLLTIDYGDLSDHLVERPNGTVRCFSRHVVYEDFLERIGEQDITADANFSALIAYGAEFGLRTVKLERQGDFLISLGLLDRLQSVTNFEGDTPEALKARLALKHFLVPGGFGDHFKVLFQEKLHV